MPDRQTASRAERTHRLALLPAIFLAAGALADSPLSTRRVTFEDEQHVPAVLDEVDDDTADEPGKRAREFIVAPLPSRSPLLGWTLAVPAMVLYKPASLSSENANWITGVAAFYSDSKSRGVGLFHRMSLGGDQWRVNGGAFDADLNYRFYGIGGDPDTAVPLAQSVRIVFLQALYRVRPNLYAGLRVTRSVSEVSLDIDTDDLPGDIELPDLGIDIALTNLAPRLRYDSRDVEFYPTDGTLAEVIAGLGRESLGSDSDYEKYEASYNRYRSLSDRGVLAVRLHAEYLAGDAPFYVYPAFGADADLRGYATGAYRDRFLLAGQAEYRHRLGQRVGAVAFAGIGTVAAGFADWDDSLWSVGAGLRWIIAPKNHMSLRVDVARGRDSTEFYVGLGEAF